MVTSATSDAIWVVVCVSDFRRAHLYFLLISRMVFDPTSRAGALSATCQSDRRFGTGPFPGYLFDDLSQTCVTRTQPTQTTHGMWYV